MSSLFRSLLAWTGRILLVLYFAAATLILVGRHWILPEIGTYRPWIEQRLSEAIGLPVTIGGLSAAWPGLHPHLVIEKLQLHDREGRPALAFDRVEADIGWPSLLFLEPRLHRLEIVAPVLDVRRDAAGTIHIAGLPMRDEGDSDFLPWLLAQYRIVVRDARILWLDELRGAPPLELQHLNLQLRNLGSHHSFGLTTEPSAQIATRLDLRGNLVGHNPADLSAWKGELYADLGQLDLAAWAPWITLPLDMTRGQGDLRLWLSFANRVPTRFTANLRLEELGVRFGEALPPLALQHVAGRLSWHRTEAGQVGEIREFSLSTDAKVAVEPTDALLKLDTGKRQAGGEFRANTLDLGALAALVKHLPVPEQMHQRLQQYSPQGRLSDIGLIWQGAPEAPTHWHVKGSFARLGVVAHEALPGFAGLAGRVEGDERAGQVVLDSRNVTVDLPAVFPEPTLTLSRLEAEVGWRTKAGMTEILFQRVNFINDDAKGEATGSYRYTGQGPGEIDLAAKLSDGAGNVVWRYMPLAVNKDARDWLRTSILGGRADSATLRLKGPLAQFPFRGGKGGIFQVKGTFRGGQLDYAPGWPGIVDIDGDLLFEGERMLIRGQRATIMGVGLSDVRAEIADLESAEETLVVTGRAKGETQRFLNFIEASPVGTRIDHFTETMAATGSGELDLKLILPLRRIDTTQVQGRYRFADNRLDVLKDVPPFTAAQGEFSFTADRMQAKNLRARFLDQPLALEIGTLPGGSVRINAAGTLEANGLRRHYGLRVLDHLSGETPWRGVLTVKKPTAELRIESTLAGLASSLPMPLNKSAATALPLLVQGRIEPQRNDWTLTLGDFAGVRLQGTGESWRGRLALGAAAVKQSIAQPPLPAQGIALAVNLPRIEADAWRALLDNGNGEAGKTGGFPALSLIDLRSPELQVAHRMFHDVQLQGTRSESRWRFGIESREAQGQITWDGTGAGRIVARLSRLTLPASDAQGGTQDPEPPDSSREMPALDLTIDNFRVDELALGELKVKAENRDGAWQAKLDVRNDAAQLSGDGRWRPAGTTPAETGLVFKLDVNNAEKLLDRLGMPDALRRGVADISGDIRWSGNPFAFDSASLSGRIKADIGKGQFKKLEPGVGRLLGVLSLQSLPRRITLDFRDIFSEGFAFDSIAGEATIAKGVMQTDELRIRGPAAKVLLSGQVDLPAETQNLKVRVQPALGETLAVGAMIANPAIGAVAWAAQKILNDPLDQIFAFEYAVTGGWDDPKVEKIQRKFSEQMPNVP